MPSPEELAPVESTSASDFYTWTFPGAPVRIHLYLAVVERLNREVRRAFESVPNRGVEIGGLLLGTADLYGSHIIEIKEFEPFLCEYRPDHKFILSAADRRKLEKTLADHRSTPADQLKVVGYYRSQVGDGLSLSQEDLSIIQAYFFDPASVFLLAKPSEDSTTAGFFFWDNGQIDSEFTYLEFPFDARQLTGSRVKPTVAEVQQDLPLDPLGGAGARPRLAPAVPAVFEEPALDQEGPPGRKTSRLWLFWFALLMIVIGALGYQAYMRLQVSSRPPAPAADAPSLALQVERRGGDLRVAWNRMGSPVRHAKDAVLLIRDGETQEQELRLDLDQLRTGSVIYTPVTNSVQFRLEVDAEDGSKTSETVLALTASRPGSPGDASAVPPPGRQASSPPAAKRSPEPPPTVTRKAFAPPASQSASSEPVRVVMVEPPSQVVNSPAPVSNLMPQPRLGPPPPAPSSPSTPVTSASAVPKPAYVAARPIREAQPSLPPTVRAMVSSLVEVQIKVAIDESGRVVQADPIASTGPVSSFLVGAARNAARLWVFEPARRGDRPVSSEMILKFQYRPIKNGN